MTQLVLATRSEGKLRELRALFSRFGFNVVDLRELGIIESESEQDVERFDTFEENALAKARYFHSMIRRPVIADDSGLNVDVLGGAPGVRSKRWSGRSDLHGQGLDDANNEKLLNLLQKVSAAERTARYVCVAAYADDNGTIVRRGESVGRIDLEPSGAGGFGYDPYFYSTELEMTFAEATLEAKEAVSHRGRAFRALIEALRSERTAERRA